MCLKFFEKKLLTSFIVLIILCISEPDCGLVHSCKDGKSREVAFAFQTKGQHSLRHCAMNLIDCVAHAHDGGAWPLSTFEIETDSNVRRMITLSCMILEMRFLF